MISFDENGFVKPYKIIELSLKEFSKHFVESLEERKHRANLFENYLKTLEEMRKLIERPFYQWVDGSYITRKKIPNDIDIVSFIQSDIIVKKGRHLLDLKKIAKQRDSIDLHYSPTCKWNHRLHEESKKYKENWLDIFGFSRRDTSGLKHPKEIIQINH